MLIQNARVTLAEFEEFTGLSENADKLFEFIGGEIVEVPSNPYSSYIGGWILTYINMYLIHHPIGFATGEQGGYMVSGERYAPDVAFLSKDKQSEIVSSGYNPNVPDLAVEVISPSDTQRRLSVKIANYMADGSVVWVVYQKTNEIEVYEPNQPVKILGLTDTLTGGTILPDFSLAVKDILDRPDKPQIKDQ